MQRWRPRLSALLIGVACSAALAAPARAQLRPLDPLDWSIFRPGTRLIVRGGFGIYSHQRASLAGTEGRLVELGNIGALWRLGRVTLAASGTVQRLFKGETVFAAPAGGARPPTGGWRHDTGSFRLGTIVRLLPPDTPGTVVLRFGTRLPTTDNRVGLGRDRIDFYALLGSRLEYRGISLGAEGGIGIHGTRDPGFEQSDVLLYAVTLGYERGPFSAALAAVGQQDAIERAVRGTEDLHELRLRLRAGTGLWVQALVIKGLTEFSPELGLRIGVGWTLRDRSRADPRR